MPYAIIATHKEYIRLMKKQKEPTVSDEYLGKLVIKDTLKEAREFKKWAKSKGYSTSKIAKTPKDWK